ncbi:hypothetical protein GXU00_004853 [Escherichia coli]|nr:hypothetical protein [Escherichia coli]
MRPHSPSNFYTREIKKMRHAGGCDADMGISITEIKQRANLPPVAKHSNHLSPFFILI